jgi:hypothetical protein
VNALTSRRGCLTGPFINATMTISFAFNACGETINLSHFKLTKRNTIVLNRTGGCIGTAPNKICCFGRNLAKITCPDNEQEAFADLFLEILVPPMRLVLTHVEDGLEISFQGQHVLLPLGTSLLITPPTSESFPTGLPGM